MEGLETVFLVRGHCHPQAVTTTLYVLLDVKNPQGFLKPTLFLSSFLPH